ncbi:Pup--protein ligase [Micrococcales bacterium 31B]|nr:Pup--protein ligase [Micrococcales bacterium 31B]
MLRRIFGIETEYGLAAMGARGQRVLMPEEAARYLFRPLIAQGGSSNVFLRNGSRLYLDVGSHPEYATAECDNLVQLITHERAGSELFVDMMREAHDLMDAEGVEAGLHMFKNNTDSAGNSYGCHENYLLARNAGFAALASALIPFLVTRQITTGAGKIVSTDDGPRFTFSQRAEHLWDGLSNATTRSRPIINTRDEPHADAEKYRRLHVISGDTSMAEPTTFLKVGSADLLLRLLEANVKLPDYTMTNVPRSIREISLDLSGRHPIPLRSGTTTTALQVQRDYLAACRAYLEANPDQRLSTDAAVLDLWQRALDAVETGDISGICTEIDWAIKLRLIRQYQEKAGLALDDPKILRLDLAYHDIDPQHSVFAALEGRGQIVRLSDPAAVELAKTQAPETTRATLRGRFIAAAQDLGRHITVDWMHLKVNDGLGKTVQLRDPFETVNPRVEVLIEKLATAL